MERNYALEYRERLQREEQVDEIVREIAANTKELTMPNEAIERAIYAWAQSRKDALGGLPKMPTPDEVAVFIPHMRAAISAYFADVPVSETIWDGLPRQIIMWMDFDTKTPRALFKHLERSGFEVPQWLRDEPEMQSLDHVPSKGTRAVIIHKAMCLKHAEELSNGR